MAPERESEKIQKESAVGMLKCSYWNNSKPYFSLGFLGSLENLYFQEIPKERNA